MLSLGTYKSVEGVGDTNAMISSKQGQTPPYTGHDDSNSHSDATNRTRGEEGDSFMDGVPERMSLNGV